MQALNMATFKRLLLTFAIVIILSIGAFGVFIWDIYRYGETTPAGPHNDTSITIAAGQGLTAIAFALYQKGIIAHPQKMVWLARLKGLDKQIQAGEYRLSSAMAPDRILALLVSGKVTLYRLTIPEGTALKRIATLFDQNGFGSQEAFLAIANEPQTARHLDIPADNLEGYLFPDTYLFTKPVDPRQAIVTMVKRFKSVFKPAWQTRAAEIGLSVHEVVTLASIIEKETGTANERPLISSVFHNRLQKGMRLETDPTVIYGIENFDGNLTRKHLEHKTPYNTYRIEGLPPGPIASPGASALEAALYPADSPYLFFVSKKDATHHFSSNLEEHNRAVRKYQLNR
jgi:UPF0755 protein